MYQFLPPTPAIARWRWCRWPSRRGLRHQSEALGATAALGAFFAPIVIGQESGSVNLLLLYLGAMAVASDGCRRSGTGGSPLSSSRWPTSASRPRASCRAGQRHGLYLYGILGGAAGLFVGLREGWMETRILSFAGGWGDPRRRGQKLADSTTGPRARWHPPDRPGLVAALASDSVWPGQRAAGRCESSVILGETFYFYLTPMLLGFALREVSHGHLRCHAGPDPAVHRAALPGDGFAPGAPISFAVVAAAALGVAANDAVAGLAAVWALLVAGPPLGGADHGLKRADGRWYALVTFALALSHLLVVDLPVRPTTNPLSSVAGLSRSGGRIETPWPSRQACSGRRSRASRAPDPVRYSGRSAGLMLLFGVTGELSGL